jgi:hypothetical protein
LISTYDKIHQGKNGNGVTQITKYQLYRQRNRSFHLKILIKIQLFYNFRLAEKTILLNMRKKFLPSLANNHRIHFLTAFESPLDPALSTVQGEDEFLCPPGIKFDVQKKEGEPNTYILEEK